MLAPEHVPLRYCEEPQLALLQVVHAPFLFVEPSLSHWPTVQVGWSAQLPLDVADWPVRYWPCGHSSCAPQVKPLVVPPQLPDRN